jgi:hypothetical protein
MSDTWLVLNEGWVPEHREDYDKKNTSPFVYHSACSRILHI